LKKAAKPRTIDFVMYPFQFVATLDGCLIGTGEAWLRVDSGSKGSNHNAREVT
jgi:hypothetical protein